MTAIALVVDSDGPVIAIVVTADPDRELRAFRSHNRRVAGFAGLLWCGPHEVAARRVAEVARETLEKAGWGRDGRWLGAPAGMIETVLRRVALEHGAELLDDEQRLRRAGEAMRRGMR